MKNNLFLGLAVVTMLFSCTTDDTSDITIYDQSDNSVTNNTTTGGGTEEPEEGETIYLTGTFSTDLTLDPINEYILNGPLIMESGTTLTIPAGMTIKATAGGANIYIAISQGAKIQASGTPTKPIVLTSNSSTPAAGDWGGLILLGKAPINSATGTATSTSEIGGLPFGGNISNDNSGVIQYLRVEYSGGAADGQTENNGLSFYGVGSGTIVQYVESYKGKDDGLEFYGGTVNVSYIYAIDNEDDSIDWTEGYTGTLTHVYVKQSADHDKAFECDGYNTDFSNAAGYFSKPTVNNVTIIGQGNTTGTEAIRLRAGTQGIFNNILINGFEEGFDLDGDAGSNPTGDGVVSGDLNVTDVTFVDVTTKVKNDTGVTFNIDGDFILSGDGDATGTDFATWGAGWSRE